ncbi:hypothetical protein [Leptolyngbya sp. FACHB-321]|uniref:hypothetical protein n=1 Tax=Leptolyngbya sp. FACHB-321 TaxID=2692807 RepID=UPI001683ED45|nr:hypothetical protein [Leptolyngbya sp. FACHB-321]
MRQKTWLWVLPTVTAKAVVVRLERRRFEATGCPEDLYTAVEGETAVNALLCKLCNTTMRQRTVNLIGDRSQ